MQMHTPQRPILLHGGMLGETSPESLLNMSLTAVQSQHLTNNESSKLGFKDALDLMTSLCPNEKEMNQLPHIQQVVEHVHADVLNTPLAVLHLKTKQGIAIPVRMTVWQAANTICCTPGSDPNSELEKCLIKELQSGSTTLNLAFMQVQRQVNPANQTMMLERICKAIPGGGLLAARVATLTPTQLAQEAQQYDAHKAIIDERKSKERAPPQRREPQNDNRMRPQHNYNLRERPNARFYGTTYQGERRGRPKSPRNFERDD